MMRCLLALAWTAAAAVAALIPDVRAAIARHDFPAGERLITAHRAQHGVTPEMLEALSWLGRGAQADKDWEAADRYAGQTRQLVLELLKKQPLDADRHLPIALGASIEVQASVLAVRGARSEAVAFLTAELAAWRGTSIRTRIQKNLHLLSLEGTPAPPLELSAWLGPKPAPPAAYKGKALLLFFWAHWCKDCKAQAPALERLRREYGSRGLVVVAPTRLYGYVARGEEAGPKEELAYIEQVRRQFYGGLLDVPAPVSEENFQVYGSSTTPTLVLADRQGLVRMYHPGQMSYEELASKVEAALR